MVVLFTLCADDDYELDDVIDGDVDDDDGDYDEDGDADDDDANDEDPQLKEAPSGCSVQLLCRECFPIGPDGYADLYSGR